MAKILTIDAKCADRCNIHYSDGEGIELQKFGYVPRGIGIGGGDYIRLQIDIETGKVLTSELLIEEDIIDELEP